MTLSISKNFIRIHFIKNKSGLSSPTFVRHLVYFELGFFFYDGTTNTQIMRHSFSNGSRFGQSTIAHRWAFDEKTRIM